MNATEPLLIEPEVRHVGTKLLLAMLGVLWILLLLTGLRSDTNIDTDADVLLFISCLYLLALCWRVANTLAEAVQVLGQRRTPAQLWHAWSKLAMRAPNHTSAMTVATAHSIAQQQFRSGVPEFRFDAQRFGGVHVFSSMNSSSSVSARPASRHDDAWRVSTSSCASRRLRWMTASAATSGESDGITRKCSSIASQLSTTCSRPSRMKATCDTSRSRSLRIWLEMMMVRSRDVPGAVSLRNGALNMARMKSRRVSGSRLDIGSSSSSRSGSCASASTSDSFCWSPPDSLSALIPSGRLSCTASVSARSSFQRV